MATFKEVLKEETEQIVGQREPAEEPEGVGLAFSGGGIRSATFNLGILQGLANANLLRKVNYLSTVSGGGYIGAWLISWIRRADHGFAEVEDQLGHFRPRYTEKGFVAEPEQVSFLRDYSNYMTPRLGFFGADTWAGIATYLRNLFLNQLILVALLSGIAFLPWCALTASRSLSPTSDHRLCAIEATAVVALLLLIWTVGFASWQSTLSSYTRIPPPKTASQGSVLILAVLPLFCSAVFTMFSLWLAATDTKLKISEWSSWKWMMIGGAAYGLAHGLGVISRFLAISSIKREYESKQRPSDPPLRLTVPQWTLIPLFALVAGAVAGLLLELLNKLFVYWKVCGSGLPHALTWGPFLFVVMFLIVGALHIGLLKTLIQNEEQEWWGRAGGLILTISIAWMGLFALTMFVPWLFATEGEWMKTKLAALIAWGATTVFGVVSGKSSKTSGKGDGNPALEMIALVSPYIFILGLMVLLSSGTFWLAKHDFQSSGVCCSVDQPKAHGRDFGISLHVDEAANSGAFLGLTGRVVSEPTDGKEDAATLHQAEQQFWEDIRNLTWPKTWGCAFVLFVIAALLAWRVDINIFSMNLLYRNRLVRCYLGASRRDCTEEAPSCKGRRPNPFTGFDPNDDVPLALFRTPPKVIERQRASESEATQNVVDDVERHPYDGPYPIFCAALNVTHGERLAWQERKAESFVFAPVYCGYEFAEMHGQTSDGAYQPTEQYAYSMDKEDPSHPKIGGIRLGTAISISGAAASPNMGYHTSPPLAFLMTMFDVRLGWWLANSRYLFKDTDLFKVKGAPRWSLVYLLKELFASTTDESRFVYMSDGGHFENLAVYELVRRRCMYIIACDADADDKVQFGDLGNLIRKCRSDFGVEIAVDTTKMQPNRKGFAEVHAVVGTITYPPLKADGENEIGHILYIKPTVTKSVTRDVLAYRDTHPAFPYQTTADQWFDESQFESYRKLGRSSFESVLESGGFDPRSSPPKLPSSFAELFSKLPKSAAPRTTHKPA
jgi:hypothetical protein